MITVKGENLLVLTDNQSDKIEIGRFDAKEGFKFLEFNSMEELKKALEDPNMDWGKQPGLNELNDLIIP